MINTATILKNVKLNHKLLIKAVRTLNTYAETAEYRRVARGEHVFNAVLSESGEYSVTVTGYMDCLDTSDSLLLSSAQAACFPLMVSLVAGLS